MTIALCDALIFTGEAMIEGHALVIKDGKVADIVANRQIPADAEKISHADQILAPGFIDAQVNGGGNVLFNNDPSTEACIAIADAHARYGTTRLLPTCISDTPEVTTRAVAAAHVAHKSHAGVLGIHLEGPHLSAVARGVHKLDYIRPCTDADLSVYRRSGDEIFLITIAPENITPDQIRQLKENGLIISIGHTDAAPEPMRQAFAAGVSGYTHLFNGMAPDSGMRGRAPGPIGIALDDRNCWCGIIADGYHVSAEMIRLAVRAKPQGKAFLVSDAMASSATESSKSFQLYGEEIFVENKRCTTRDGNLAGASITLSDAVRHCVKNIGIVAEEALRMASLYPAAFLGLDKKLGKLLPGYTADVVALDKEFRPKAAWRAGKSVA